MLPKEKGYFKAGVDVDLKLPPEENSSGFGNQWQGTIYYLFQDYMAKLEKAQDYCRCHIVEHNTSGNTSLVNLIM